MPARGAEGLGLVVSGSFRKVISVAAERVD